MIETYHKGFDRYDDDDDAGDDNNNEEAKVEVRIVNCCLPHDKFC